jgi:hypothetical protein
LTVVVVTVLKKRPQNLFRTGTFSNTAIVRANKKNSSIYQFLLVVKILATKIKKHKKNNYFGQQ